MILLRNKFTGWLFVFLLLGFISNGQVLVRTTLDKDKILVGEPVKITVEARMPLGETLSWFVTDSIPHLEWTEKAIPQETDGIDGKIVQQTFTATSYDTGYWTIPRFTIKVANKSYSSDTLGIQVAYSEGFNAEENYRDIKETEAVEVLDSNTKRWIFFAAGAVMLLLLLYLLLRKKKKITAASQGTRVALSPFEEAQKQLQELRKERPADAVATKSFYTRLNDVFRNYLVQQFNVSALEKTNEEVVQQLQQLNLPAEQLSKTKQALQLADFVKFAKYQPGQEDHSNAIDIIDSAIKLLNKPAST